MALRKNNLLLTTTALAREIGVSSDAIRLWQRKGTLKPRRTTSGTRIFTQADRRVALAYRASEACANEARS